MSIHSKGKFLCQMEANPGDVEVSWYLNNSYSERKLLLKEQTQITSSDLDAPDRDSNLAKSLTSGDNTTTIDNSDNHNNNNNNNEIQPSVPVPLLPLGRIKNNDRVSSQLNYIVDSPLDYGRLYCVAKNSIGQQKRACIYEIKPPGKPNNFY